MNIIFVDYSETYYSDIAGITMPDKIIGKFMQIRNNQIEYLIFAPKELDKYHANLVERFCMDRGLKGEYAGEEKRFDIRDPGWAIVGGGKFEIDKSTKQIRIYDNSMAYGRFDSKRLAEKIHSIGKLSDYQVQIY